MDTTPDRHAYPAHWEADVVLRDGGTARVQPITADDADRLVSFYEQVSDESKFYRFFAPYPRLSANDVRRFTHHDFVDRVGLAAVVGGEFIATVRYDRIDDQGMPAHPPADEAEVAFLVQDAHQGRGVASALLEHIAAVARERGIRRFMAEVLPANNKMTKVFTDAGYQQQRSFEDGVVHLGLDLAPTEASRAVQLAREQRAEARSVQRLLRPGSVVVIGTGRAPGGVGRSILGNLLSSGYTGRVHAVNRSFPPDVTQLDGVPAHRSLAEVGEPVDLAVVAVPADRVPDAVDACGEHGVQGLVVVSAGYAERGAEGLERQRALVRQVRSYGMRLVGPNAFGIVNTAPDVLLNASLAPQLPRAGRIGLFTQSGAIGIALLARLHRRGGGTGGAGPGEAAADAGPAGTAGDARAAGHAEAARTVGHAETAGSSGGRADTPDSGDRGDTPDAGGGEGAGNAGASGIAGISSFVSAGNRADVSGNDVLQYWYEDPDTDVGLMYLETIGNPRKFTRLARRTALSKPLVVVQGARHSGSAPPGHAVPHTRLPHAVVSALLRQAGVIRVDTITELVDVGLQLAVQPLPRGPRVAVVGNSESLGLLTYDACLSEGLRPLRPRDLTTGATPADFDAALRAALTDDACDAVVVTVIPSVGAGQASDTALATALRTAAAAHPGKPVSVVHVELGGLAAALSAAGSTAPDAPRTAPATTPAPLPTPGAAATADPPHPPHLADPADPPPSDSPAGLPPGGPSATRVPAFPAPERAVRALSEAVRHAAWLREAAEPGRVPHYDDTDEKRAAGLVSALLERSGPDAADVTLAPADTEELLAAYGIRVCSALPAPDPGAAVRAARRLGYPVALKTTAPHLRHRADLGGVRLDLAGEEELRRAYTELTETLGGPGELLPVVQAMVPRGVDTVVRAVIDPTAGAVLSFGLAGAASELLGDMAHRLIPVTDREARSLIRSLRTAPLLFGWRGAAPVDTTALEELLQRVSRLVDDHPEVVAVSLEPVVVATHGLSVLGASVRLAPPPARSDLGPRTMPAY